jgi:hypothetical protein
MSRSKDGNPDPEQAGRASVSDFMRHPIMRARRERQGTKPTDAFLDAVGSLDGMAATRSLPRGVCDCPCHSDPSGHCGLVVCCDYSGGALPD